MYVEKKSNMISTKKKSRACSLDHLVIALIVFASLHQTYIAMGSAIQARGEGTPGHLISLDTAETSKLWMNKGALFEALTLHCTSDQAKLPRNSFGIFKYLRGLQIPDIDLIILLKR